MSSRAGIVVTGTEVLTGRVVDRNGPWLADRLLELGVELAHITICGDRPQDIEAQLRFLGEQGCRGYQGYYFRPAVPHYELEELLGAGRSRALDIRVAQK